MAQWRFCWGKGVSFGTSGIRAISARFIAWLAWENSKLCSGAFACFSKHKFLLTKNICLYKFSKKWLLLVRYTQNEVATCTCMFTWNTTFYQIKILFIKIFVFLIILYNYVKIQVLQILFMQVKIVLVILESSYFSEKWIFLKKPSCILKMLIVHLKNIEDVLK